ncbi:MAG TPA: ABC transporter permease [Pyrinomonadaceae bacterium]|nr:ABC transporter permease [Pyrinomonadaceae bacterium]
MPLIPRLASLWRNLLQRERVEREFNEEIEAYLELLTEAKLREGLGPGEARRAALVELGGVDQVKERVREVRMGHFLETVWQDVRYGARVLLKSPVFTAVAVVSLALGIGANTAIFSVVNGILLRPLPYPDSGRLMAVWHTPPRESFPGMDKFSVSPGNYLDWKEQSRAFEQMSVYQYAGFSMSAGDQPAAVVGATVSPEFFSVLRTEPGRGRAFFAEEAQPGRDQSVVLSHGLWQRAFGGDPGVLGRTLTLNSRSFTVVGIMPAGFEFPAEAELWVPLAWDGAESQVREIHDYMVVARLRPDASLEQARAEMNTISSRLEAEYPEANKGWGAVVVPLQEDLTGDMRPALLVLFSAVGFVLLIACANVANLLLARGANRRKEIAIRIALGAGRARVVRQLLSESVLLAVAGGLLGLLLANWGSRLLVQLSSGSLGEPTEIGLDRWALGFTLLVSFAAGIVAGIAPAFQFTPDETGETLKQGAGKGSSGSVRQRTRKALVVSEVALSLILLIGAGLMLRSFWKLQHVDPGFETGNVLTMSVGLPPAKYSDPRQQATFYDRALEQIGAVPGVVAVGATTTLPLTGQGSTQPFAIEGRPAQTVAEQPSANVRYVSPDYFRALGIPLRRGRVFGEHDREGAAQVVVVSETMARRFWPGEEAVGKRLTPSFHLQQGPREVVGVVGDVKSGLDNEPSATIYMPYKQAPRPWMTFAARTASDPQNFVQAVSKAIYAVDKDQALSNVRTMDQVLATSLAGRRFNMTLLIAFAALALVLAAVGVYGVINYSVMLRRHELGIRMALGAQATDVLRLVLGQGLALTLTGVGIGLAGAYALTRLMSSLLYGVTATDAVTFLTVSGVMIAVGLLASYLPARRATKLDPMIALRPE